MRIGIVNNLASVAELIRRIVTTDPNNSVMWVALNGADAVALCAHETPDIVLMELIMPAMDGVEATRRIMAGSPCAIVIVTPNVVAQAGRVFDAMGLGALDAVDTPLFPEATGSTRGGLLIKIATIARLLADKPARARETIPNGGSSARRGLDSLIAIGASTGGPAALAEILQSLPASLSAAVVIVQHVDARFAAGMAAWLNQKAAVPVRAAVEGDRPRAGEILVAATTDHLAFKTADHLGYIAEPVDYPYRPSVDVFFQSACRLWRGDIVGVLLTGMGRDGAAGLKALRDRGHHTVAQDRATSAVYGMPKTAAMMDAAVEILPINRIAGRLIEVLNCRPSRL